MSEPQIKETTYVKDLGFEKWVMLSSDDAEIVTYGNTKELGLHTDFQNAWSVAKKAKKFSGNQIALYQSKNHWNEKNELETDLVQVGVI